MKKTFNIDGNLLKEARLAVGATTDTEAIRQGLQALVRRAAYQRLRTFLGSEAGSELVDVPRRREKLQADIGGGSVAKRRTAPKRRTSAKRKAA